MDSLHSFVAIILLICSIFANSWVITHQDLREVGASFLPTNWKLGDDNPFSRITSDCETTYFEIHNGETIKKNFTINYVQFSNIRIELNLYFFNMVDSQVIISINGAQIYSNNFLASHYPTQSTLCSGPAYQYLFRTQFAITTKPVNQIYEIQLSYTQLTTSASAYLGIRDLVISTDSPTSTNGCPMEYPVLGVNGECQQYCIGTCYEINAGYCSNCCPCPDGVINALLQSCYKNNDYSSDSYCSIYCDTYQQQLRGPFLDQCVQPSITSSVYRDPLTWSDYSLGPKTPDSNYQDLNLEKYLEFSSSHASTVEAAIYSDTSINPGYILQLQGSIYIIGTWEVGSYVEITLFCDSEFSLFKIESDGTKFTTSNGIATQEVSLTLFDSTTITAKRVQIQVQGYDGDGGNYILLYQNLLGTTASYALSQFYTITALKNDGTCQSSVLENHCISCYSPLFAYLGGCVSECPTHSIVSTSNRNCTDYKDSETVSMFPFLTTNGIGTYLLKAFNDLTFDDTTIGTIFPSSPCIADNCLNSQRYSLLPTMKMFGGYNSWGKGSYSKSWSGLQTHYQIRIYFKLYFIDSWTNSDSFTISIDGVQYAQESILGLTETQIAGTSELDYMKSVFYRIPHSASTLSIEFLCIDSESGSALTASCGITDLYVLSDQDITPLCPTDEYYSFYTNTCRTCAGVCSTLGCILFETNCKCHYSCKTCTGSGENQCSSCDPNKHRVSGVTGYCNCDTNNYTVVGQNCVLTVGCHYSCQYCFEAANQNSCATCPNPGTTFRQSGSNMDCVCATGYYDNGAQICIAPFNCHHSCATCSTDNSITDCLTCPPSGNNRTTGSATSCPCDPGYEDIGVVLCTLIACHHSCGTCSVANSENGCLTCPPPGNNRSTGSATTCPCDPGYEDTGAILCTLPIICHHSCATCTVADSITSCLTCPPPGNNRTTGSATSCPCDPGYEDTGAVLCTLIACHHSCGTCSIANSENGCLTCPPPGNNRTTGSANSCPCDPGYEDTGSITCDLISPCDVSCSLCSVISSSTDCVTCPPTSNRVLSGHTCLCVTGYQETSPIQQNCIPICDYSCLTCSLPNSSSSCVTCPDNATSHRTKTGTECLCDTDYSDDGSNQNCTFVCDSTCLTCTAPGSSSCSSCDGALDRIDGGNNDCVCKDGYHDISGSCEQITPCHVSCLLCSLVSSSNSCVSCDASSHRALNTSSQCLCDPGYEDNSNPLIGTCSLISCHYSCLTCSASNSSTSCLTCPDPSTSYRLPMAANICSCQSNYAEVPGEVNCQPICHFTCESCSLPNSSTNCYTCPDQSTSHRIPGSNNDCPCESGYLSIPDQVNCQIQCHYSCLTCSLPNSFNSCLTCPDLSSSHRSANYSNQCPCITGYKEDNNSVICISDCHYSCSTCSQSNSASQCLSCPVQSISHRILINTTCLCEDNYFENENEDQINCSPVCHQTCQTCSMPLSQTSCLSCDLEMQFRIFQDNLCICKLGYIEQVNLDGDFVCLQQCHYSCDTCSLGNSESHCLSCLDQTISHRALNQDGYCRCNDGYFDDGTQFCSIQCHYSCLTCSVPNSDSDCDQCPIQEISHRIQTGNQCLCEAFYVDFNQKNCLPCPSHCDTCSKYNSQIYCDACSGNRTFIEGACLCQVGYYENNGECLVCNLQQMELCLNSHGLSKPLDYCDDQNYKNRDGCSEHQVDQGYTCLTNENNKSICFKCDQKACAQCQIIEFKYFCVSCAYGYYLTNNSCEKCPQECSTCVVPNKCETCKYGIENGQCKKCDLNQGKYYGDSGCISKCGDGIVAMLEQCDDGNTANLDGCSSQCLVESGFKCSKEHCEQKLNLSPQVEYTNRTTKNSILLKISNINSNCSNLTLWIENTDKEKYDYDVIDLNFTDGIACESILTFYTSVESYDYIHLVIWVQDQLNKRILAEAEPMEIVIQARSKPYYSEEQTAQAQTIKSTQQSLGVVLAAVGPATVIFGGFDIFFNILDILTWINNFYFLNVNYPLNVDTIFKYALWGEISFLEIPFEFNSEGSEYFTNGPIKFEERNIDPLFINNAWGSFLISGSCLFSFLVCKLLVSLLNRIYCNKPIIPQKNTSQDPIKSRLGFLEAKYGKNKNQAVQAFANQEPLQMPKIIKFLYEFLQYYSIEFSGILIKCLNLTYLDMCLASVMQIKYMDNFDFVIIQINYLFAVLLLFASLSIILITIKISQQSSKLLKNKSFSKKYGDFYLDLNIKNQQGRSYIIFNYLVKMLFIIGLVIFYETPIMQCTFCCAVSFFNAIYLIFMNPFKSKSSWIQNALPDISFFCILLLTIIFAIDDQVRIISSWQKYFIGWFMVAAILLSILIQFIFILQEFIQSIKEKFRFLKKMFCG